MRLETLAIALLGLTFGASATADAAIRLGVVAPAGEAAALEQWSPVAELLGESIGEPVNLAAASPGELLQMLESGELDVVIGNPVQAAVATIQMGAQPVASVVRLSGAQFGGVIVANPNSGVTSARDLRGKKVISLQSTAAGGYIFQTHYLTDLGMSVPDDFERHATAKNQRDIVNLVARGAFDAGFVRTGMVENMIRNGDIAEGDVIIVDQKQTDGFPQVHTTDLYPEWMVFANDDLDRTSITQIRRALIAVTSDNPALSSARVRGFEAPQDLGRVIDALETVGMLEPTEN